MQDVFEKYRKRLVKIGIFKSVLLGLALCFSAVGIAALATWIARATLSVVLGLTLGLGAAVFLVSVPLFYFKRFRPTERTVVGRLDALGLEERIVTMYELKDDPSRMAALQREDAVGKLSAVSEKLLKFTVALPVALLLGFCSLFAAGATAASVIAADGRPEITDLPEPSGPEAKETFTVTYMVYEAGTGEISGRLVQKVEKGGFTQAVTAVPAEGFRFEAWVDEHMTPFANQNNPRAEINVRGDMTVYAYFEKEEPPASGDDPGENGEDGDKTEPNDGQDGDDNGDTNGGNSDEYGDHGNANDGSNGEGRENNKVIDGTQDYKELFDREQSEEELGGKDIPDELKDILGDYYDTLKP